MKEIPLTRGKVAFVDDEDFERLIKFKWCAIQNQSCKKSGNYYAHRKKLPFETNEGAKIVSMHRFIFGVNGFSTKVHHINKNGLDNRKSNLKVTTENGHKEIHRLEHLNKFLVEKNIIPEFDIGAYI